MSKPEKSIATVLHAFDCLFIRPIIPLLATYFREQCNRDSGLSDVLITSLWLPLTISIIICSIVLYCIVQYLYKYTVLI